MTTDHAELLSAFMDREAVDPEALARALEDPEARRALVAFASVRRMLHVPAPGEAAWLREQARRLGVRSHRPRDRWRVAAAAALVAATVGAAGIAQWSRTSRPPEPARVVQLEPIAVDRP